MIDSFFKNRMVIAFIFLIALLCFLVYFLADKNPAIARGCGYISMPLFAISIQLYLRSNKKHNPSD